MRVLIATLTALLLAVALLFGGRAETVERAAGPVWIKITFGIDGQSTKWDGQATATTGKILRIAEWSFEERDSLSPESFAWKIETGILDARRMTYAEPTRGVLLEVSAIADAKLRVTTAQGNFDVAGTELIAGRPFTALEGRATVELLGSESTVAETATDDDFASIAVDARGHRHVAWIAYDDTLRATHLLVRDVDDPQSRPEVIVQAGEVASPQLLVEPDGSLRSLWCAPSADGNWDIYTARRDHGTWKPERLTTAEGTDFQLAAARGDDGSLWLAWQSFRAGNGAVFAKRLRDGAWSDDIAVTSTDANEWQPSISIADDGTAWIGYDSYANGNYDVYLKQVSFTNQQPVVAEPIAVATSADFEAHASVLAEGKRVWVAYDAAGPNWGKDFRNIPTFQDGKYAEPLHASRRVELRCLADGRIHQPSAPLPQVLPPRPIEKIDRTGTAKPSRFYEFPQLARDGDGRMWLFFRMCRQGYSPHPPRGADWRVCATTYGENGWLEPIELPLSQGRQEQRVALTPGASGRLACAWADGNRFASVNRKYVVHHGTLPNVAEQAADIPLEQSALDAPTSPEPAPDPAFTIEDDGKTYHVYYGDLHRHTNISRCSPTIDGCLTDAHRYALDAAELDFLAITDHERDVDPFSWWRTQQAADLYHITGRYVPIYGYERSNETAGGGHRNVFYASRGRDINPSQTWYSGRNLTVPDRDPDTTLYPFLKQYAGALTAAHTPAYDNKTGKGTWTFNDPQVEPVTEIYQSFRRSFEHPDDEVKEQASVWHALDKGYRLGFIASSDHISTHCSYACIWATDKSRDALFEGLSTRRTFGATDRIVLDTRIGGALMGEMVENAGDTIALDIRAAGTAPIAEIRIIRSGKVHMLLQPNSQLVDTQYVDREPLSGDSYYYVRLIQTDGNQAWGSPIWVKH